MTENHILASDVLQRMGGFARHQAAKYLDRCDDEEVTALAECTTGKRFQEILNQVADRQNPPPKPEAETDLVVPQDPAPQDRETPDPASLEEASPAEDEVDPDAE